MDYRSGVLKILFLVFVFCSIAGAAFSQTPAPGYYYSNFQPKTLNGVTLEFSPLSMPRQGILESFKPSFLDVSIGMNFNYIPGTYKVNFAPELYLFANYASYAPQADSLIYPVYSSSKQLIDYGKINFSNITIIRGGAQLIFWNHTPKKLQVGPGIGISVGQYSYTFAAESGTSTFAGSKSQVFVMFSPCFAVKYWINSKIGVYANGVYNFIADGGKRDLSLKSINPNLGKTYSTFTPRIGVTYNFKTR